MTSITHKMADFAIKLSYEDIPAPAVKEAKRFLLDSSAAPWPPPTTRTWPPCTALSTAGRSAREHAHRHRVNGPTPPTPRS